MHKDNQVLCNPGANRATLRYYKDYLIQEYGKEKVDYIQHLYGIDLDRAESLTPEHVYRFNMGVNNVEVQDLQPLLEKLHRLQTTEHLSLDLPLAAYLAEGREGFAFTNREIRGLLYALPSKATVGDLLSWLNDLALAKNVADLTPEQLESVMQVFELTPEEHRQL